MSGGYAELHCLSNFTFLRGASHPEELVRRAAALGYRALAITDECSLAGVVRAHLAAREHDLQLIVGSELRLQDDTALVLLVPGHTAYRQLSRLITRGRRNAAKGSYRLGRADVAGAVDECLALWLPGNRPDPEQAAWIGRCFPGRAWIAVELTQGADDEARMHQLCDIGQRLGLPQVATGNVHMHAPERRPLQDTLTAIRLGHEVGQVGFALHANGQRHLRPLPVLARCYPEALRDESLRVAARCRFSLDELEYRYPAELVPEGGTPAAHLRRLVREGMARRWPDGAAPAVCAQVRHELALIEELGYEPYFLTVHDLVAFARRRGILCQGRGSAANSAVCYCLGITEVDPARSNLLFERFISRERGEPPDIDVDFEHERREEVIQYVYRKYGRRRAALAATVISYRPRSAVRDVGRALGLSPAQISALAGSLQWWDGSRAVPQRMREAGLDPDSPVLRRLAWLVERLIGFPRHLSQHVGGFVISDAPVDELVPVENAAMPGRTVIQWDKDDLDALGLLKVDVLALGMLTAIRRSFDLIEGYRGWRWSMAEIPGADRDVYAMIGRADTMGVFQIESRAQMAMLPRLQPRCFYDLVIEVAIVRPGPIQGDMVHPYLARRCGEQTVDYPSTEVRHVLERTLGVPIFQEQVMQLAIVAGGFTPDEADRLRRAMAAWRRRGGLEPFETRLVEGMRRNGYDEAFARRVFSQIRGFGEYGFPESHAASFALLVYVSAWLKCHEPAAFCAALLNSQPMGFYAPAQLVQDVRRHGVEVRPVDVLHSERDCTLERGRDGTPALRLGLRMVAGLSGDAANRLVAVRDEGMFGGIGELASRARLGPRELECLAAAGALKALAGNRHQARWRVAGLPRATPLFGHAEVPEGAPSLPVPTAGEDLVADYASLGLTLGSHPVGLLRPHPAVSGTLPSVQLAGKGDGARVRVGGLVVNRQRPGSANGVTFMTLEDETGTINVIVWPDLARRQRRELLQGRLLVVRGVLQERQGVRHVIAAGIEDHSSLLGELAVRSRDFR